MKIMLVARAYPTHRPGGLPFVVQDRARALVQLGHEVHVVTTAGGATSDEGVIIHPSPGGHPCAYSDGFAVHCAEMAQALMPDVLHLDSCDVDRRWWEGRRASCTMHGFGFGAMLTRWNQFRLGLRSDLCVDAPRLRREANALRHFEHVLAVSKHEAWMLRDCYGLRDVEIVYNPIAPYFFAPPVPRPQAAGPLCVGLDGTSYNRRFAEAGKRLGARLCRTTPRHLMPAMYDGADCLLVPTLWSQGYDLAVAEALARRRPVVAAHVGSYAREESPFLLTYSPDDWEEAAQAVIRASGIEVPADAADRHRPEAHARRWLETVA